MNPKKKCDKFIFPVIPLSQHMFEKKPPFCPTDIFPPTGARKNIHSLTEDCVARLSPRRGETQRGAFNVNIYNCIHCDMHCLINGITGFI